MRLRCVLTLAVLLGPAGLASAQTVTPYSEGPVEAFDWSGDQGRSASRWWASADYLLWWTKGAPVSVPLATTSNTSDFGVLGAPSTRLLIGDEHLDFSTRSGGRFALGGW